MESLTPLDGISSSSLTSFPIWELFLVSFAGVVGPIFVGSSVGTPVVLGTLAALGALGALGSSWA